MWGSLPRSNKMNNNSDVINETIQISTRQVKITSDTTKSAVNKVEPTKSVIAVAELEYEEQNRLDNPNFVLGYN